MTWKNPLPRNADHLCRSEPGREHRSNGLAPLDGAFGHLMVDRIRVVEGGSRSNFRVSVEVVEQRRRANSMIVRMSELVARMMVYR